MSAVESGSAPTIPVIFCLDHTKLGRQSTSLLCDLEVIDTLVTDQTAPADMVKEFRKHKIEVIVA